MCVCSFKLYLILYFFHQGIYLISYIVIYFKKMSGYKEYPKTHPIPRMQHFVKLRIKNKLTRRVREWIVVS